ERAQQMGNRTGKSIKFPNYYGIEMTSVCVCHEPIEFRPTLPGAAYTRVNVLGAHHPTSPLRKFLNFPDLHRRILAVVCCAYARVNSCSYHWFLPRPAGLSA